MLPYLTADTESGIATTCWALQHERHSHVFGFIRAESNLHIILISDEHDQSYEQPAPGVQDFAAYLEEFGQDRDELTFSTVGLPNSDYRRVTDMVGGIFRLGVRPGAEQHSLLRFRAETLRRGHHRVHRPRGVPWQSTRGGGLGPSEGAGSWAKAPVRSWGARGLS